MSNSNMINTFFEFSSNRPRVSVPNSTDVPNATDHTPDVQIKQSYCLQPN